MNRSPNSLWRWASPHRRAEQDRSGVGQALVLPLIEALAQKLPGAPIVPISAMLGDGVDVLVDEICAF